VAGKCGRSGPPAGNTNGVTHGYYSLKARLSGADLDKRTGAYKPLAEKEQELIAALGGDVSPQERIIIADTVKHLLFAASLDRYLMQLQSLVRKGKIHGVVSERTKIGVHIRENLKTLGLKRVSKEISWSDYFSEKYGEQDSGKSRSNVHVNKTVPDRQASLSVEKKELDA
jgi:hypothetical protein